MAEEGARYDQRGVSASKEDVHNAIKSIDKGLYPKAFCKIIPDILQGDDDYCNIMHADGAGTKSSLAYMYWKETGDISVWKGIAQDAIVMNLDDLLCVGTTNNILISSTIGRNKKLIPGEVIAAIINGTEEFLAEMRDQGIGIPAKEIPYIFEKMYRASNSTKISVKGTGLGLYITSQIVKAHGGKIKVKSKLSTGTEFTVLLPLEVERVQEVELEEVGE